MPSWLAHRLGRHLATIKPGALVCVTPRGGPLRTANFRRDVWTPALDAAGMDRDYGFTTSAIPPLHS